MNKEVKTLDAIMTMVCRYYSIDKKLVLGKKRDREIVMARQMFCWLSRRYTRSTFKLMGEYINRTCTWVVTFGNRVYTIYDWKTYDREYTINELNTWSIGGVSSLVYFKDALMNLIDASLVSLNK